MRASLLLLASLATSCLTTAPVQTDARPEVPVQQTLKEFNFNGEYRYKAPDSSLPSAERVIAIQVGPDMAATCGLVRTHFDFDSAEPMPQDKLEIKEIAACLNRPAIAGMSVELVGRADLKGRAGYNVDLGRRRAVRVMELLVAEGVAPARLTVTSRGSTEARGDANGDYDPSYDRRVDIVLQGVTHAPR
jgi:peptidoglycan-associated lipoprotein